jgi:hypothetical protein
MRGLVFVVGVILCIVFFGIPVLGCFAFLLALLGVAAEAAVPLGMVLAVVYIVGIGIKVFFYDP